MDAKDIHNLSEAYREVYAPQEDLDEAEGSYGQTPKARSAMGKLSTSRMRKPATEYSQKGEKTKKVKAAEKQTKRQDTLSRGLSGGKKSSRPWSARGKMDADERSERRAERAFDLETSYGAGSVTKNPKKLRKQKAMGEIGEQVDIYDIILSHLLDEGYADTEQAAEAIMVNMSEEWRDSIMISEGMTMKDFKKQRSRQKQKEKRAADKIAPTRRAGIHADKASPERASRHRANVDPDFEGDDEGNYPGGTTKNPKKLRKQKAMGENG